MSSGTGLCSRNLGDVIKLSSAGLGAISTHVLTAKQTPRRRQSCPTVDRAEVEVEEGSKEGYCDIGGAGKEEGGEGGC